MKELNTQEYEAFVAAMRYEPYDRRLFEKATSKLIFGKAVRPKGVLLDREIPRTMRDWRKDQQWSLRYVDRHQAACDAAWREFWRVMTSEGNEAASA